MHLVLTREMSSGGCIIRLVALVVLIIAGVFGVLLGVEPVGVSLPPGVLPLNFIKRLKTL